MYSNLLPIIAGLLAFADAEPLEIDPSKPDVIEFGNSVESMESALQGACATKQLRVFDPPKTPIAKESHQQIDCRGFDFLGAPRLAEFVFIDGKLQLVWILLSDEEKATTVDAMRSVYGTQGHDNSQVIAFPEFRTAWRNEPAEILFYSEEFAPAIEPRLLAKVD
jgi:hypothetical protein